MALVAAAGGVGRVGLVSRSCRCASRKCCLRRLRPLTEKIVALNAGIRRSERDGSGLEASLEQGIAAPRAAPRSRTTSRPSRHPGHRRDARRGARGAGRDLRRVGVGGGDGRAEAPARPAGRPASVDGLAFLAGCAPPSSGPSAGLGRCPRGADRGDAGPGRAAATGLIANELLTNAFKHAFPDRERGEVTVRLRRDGDDVALVVEDDGRGLGRQPAGGSGLALVRGLARQHGGTCVVEGEGGVRCSVVLRGRRAGPPPPRERRASPGPAPGGLTGQRLGLADRGRPRLRHGSPPWRQLGQRLTCGLEGVAGTRRVRRPALPPRTFALPSRPRSRPPDGEGLRPPAGAAR